MQSVLATMVKKREMKQWLTKKDETMVIKRKVKIKLSWCSVEYNEENDLWDKESWVVIYIYLFALLN